MLTSRGGFCSYWTFLRAVLMLESPSPVFFFIFFFLSGSQGRSPVRLKLISVVTGFGCFQRDVPQMR